MAATDFNCQVCLDDKVEDNPRIIEGFPVCYDCVLGQIIPQFHEALAHEHSYPPKWGPIQLRVQDYASLLGRDFISRYVRRELEYRSVNRIYCKHMIGASAAPATGGVCLPGERLGFTPAQIADDDTYPVVECGGLVSGRSQRTRTTLLCHRCNGLICAACELPVYAHNGQHVCTPIDRTVPDPVLEGQVRGRDFQSCPGCSTVIALADGCNSIRCTCGTDLCFICGEHADHDSGHWAIGRPCPRFGQRGDSRAIHDDMGVQNFLNDFAVRLQAAVQNGDRLNEEWFRQALRGAAGPHMTEEAIEAGFQRMAPMFAVMGQVEHMQEDLERMGPVLQELTVWAQERGLDMGHRHVVPLLDLHQGILDNTWAVQRLGVEEGLPLQDRAHAFLDQHRQILLLLDSLHMDILQIELPRLKDLVDRYLAIVPPWARA